MKPRQYKHARFSVGDRVQVFRGAYAGFSGVVTDVMLSNTRIMCQVNLGGMFIRVSQVDLK